MPSPFPGMDPFLESPRFFPDLHGSLITLIKGMLQSALPNAYFAASSERVWVEAPDRLIEPDVHVTRRGRRDDEETNGGVAVAVMAEPVVVTVPVEERHEPFLEIITRVDGGERVATVIELLSPSNKRPGPGRDLYLRKQEEVLSSEKHLVEIDLLRGGEHATAVPRAWAVRRAGRFDYHICVKRFDRLSDYLVYPIGLRHRLPVIAIPLLPGDGEVPLNLQTAFDQAYEIGPYRKRVRYTDPAPPLPPLSEADAAWAAERIAAARPQPGPTPE